MSIIRHIVPQYTPAHEYVAEAAELGGCSDPIHPVVQPGVVVNG